MDQLMHLVLLALVGANAGGPGGREAGHTFADSGCLKKEIGQDGKNMGMTVSYKDLPKDVMKWLNEYRKDPKLCVADQKKLESRIDENGRIGLTEPLDASEGVKYENNMSYRAKIGVSSEATKNIVSAAFKFCVERGTFKKEWVASPFLNACAKFWVEKTLRDEIEGRESFKDKLSTCVEELRDQFGEVEVHGDLVDAEAWAYLEGGRHTVAYMAWADSELFPESDVLLSRFLADDPDEKLSFFGGYCTQIGDARLPTRCLFLGAPNVGDAGEEAAMAQTVAESVNAAEMPFMSSPLLGSFMYF